MILTTTNNIEGMEIVEYKGLVNGEIVSGINFIKDIGAGIRNIFGGRSAGYEEELIKARTTALKELETNAEKLGANAVIGINISIETAGANGDMMIVSATGTAVLVR